MSDKIVAFNGIWGLRGEIPETSATGKPRTIIWPSGLTCYASDAPGRRHATLSALMNAKLKLLPLLLFCAAVNAAHGGAPKLLPADQAFTFSAVLAGDRVIRARWDIADGYYMYRDKMSFDIAGQSRLAAPAVLPDGEHRQDALFGEVAVYFSSLAVELAVTPPGPDGYTLVAKGQGCNLPVGICYPPITHRVTFPASSSITDSGAASPALRVADAPDFLKQLRALLDEGFEQPQFLGVDEAFKLEIKGIGPNRLETTFAIADGYYLYRDKIAFRGAGGVRMVETALPPGESKTDAYFGEIAVLKHDFSAPITIQRASQEAGSATVIGVHATYQGCAEDGICYSPVNKTFSVELPPIKFSDALRGAWADDDQGQPAWDSTASAGRQPSSIGAPTVSLGILLGAFLGGLLLTFTPCVLPMLPILSGVIAGQGKDITKTKGGILALAYILGTVLTYAAIGALAGATGEQLQAYFQNFWAIGIFAAVLTAMALSMFGFFKIQTPSFIQSGWQNKTRGVGGSLLPVFVIGAISALIIGACVSPVLISFLAIAVSAGDPWLGAWMMTAMALGMGIPLMALGLGAGHLLPKAGKWMKTVNHVFGVLLIGVGIYLLGSLPEVPVLLLWGAFFVILSVYLIATQPTPARAGGWRRFVKGVGAVLLIWGAAALIGGFFGERNLFKPLPAGLFTGAGGQGEQLGEARASKFFIRVATPDELDRQFARAAGQNKLVMVEYYADWCTDCVRMEQTTFRDSRVRETLQKHFVSLKIDVTDPRDENGKALKKRFGVLGPPAVLLFDRAGVELKDKHFYGYRNRADFHALITALSK